jgi:hypothetical protein
MISRKSYDDELGIVRKAELKQKRRDEGEIFDEGFGYRRYCVMNGHKESKRGWIFNMLATVRIDTTLSSELIQLLSLTSYDKIFNVSRRSQ